MSMRCLTSSRTRIEQNFTLNFELSPEDMAQLDGLNKNFRYVSPSWHSFDPADDS